MLLAILLVFATGLATVQVGEPCAFCNPQVLGRQTFYEGEKVVALANYTPHLPGHSMVIPKRHVKKVDELNPEEVQELHDTIIKVGKAFDKAFGTSDYLIYLQNGVKAGQTVPHVHYHVVPRTEKNVRTKLSLMGKVFKIFTWGVKPLSDEEMAKAVSTMKQAMVDY